MNNFGRPQLRASFSLAVVLVLIVILVVVLVLIVILVVVLVHLLILVLVIHDRSSKICTCGLPHP